MNLSILLSKVFSIFLSFFQQLRKGKTSQISAETVTASREKGRKTARNRKEENKRPSDRATEPHKGTGRFRDNSITKP